MNANNGLHPLKTAPRFRFGTWDVEAREWWNLLVIGCYDGRSYYHFKDVPHFLDHILRHEYRDFRWFAHFGGRYDLNFIFDYLRTQTDIKVSFFCSGSMVIQMTLTRGDTTVRLCDSYRLLQASLRDLTRTFGVEVQKGEMDFDTMAYNKELLEYNEADCLGLWQVLDTFFTTTGCMSETFAMHSLRLWRKEFQRDTIWKPSLEVCEFARRTYSGGHTEVLKRRGYVKCFDVNSMYPSVMRQDIPIAYLGKSVELTDRKQGFVYAKVRVPEMYIPPLPYAAEKLFFPVGEFKSYWTTEELINAERLGVKILKIYEAHYFESEPIFRECIDALYKIKQTASEPLRTITKFRLNAFYGKFGQNPLKRSYTMEDLAPKGAFPVMKSDGTPSGFAYYETESDAAYLLPHIASAVTSKARITLLEALDEKSYYCDTDSIFTTGTMRQGKKIGEWSKVGEGDAEFYQPKLYKFKGKWKAKGLNLSQDIDAFIKGQPNTQTRHRSIKEALNKDSKACESENVVKQMRETRPKRKWLSNGDTRPWDIKEIT